MQILIIGSGGREHALANAYSKSKKVKKVLVAPGNDFMTFQNEKIETFSEIKSTDFEGILNLAKKEKVDLVDVAQDDPLALGFVNRLEQKGIVAFGPTQKAAEIEWSKDWARNFMQKYNLPIPGFKVFNNPKKAIQYVNNFYENHFRQSTSEVYEKKPALYIKASGLALGKGALRAENKQKAIAAILTMKQFGAAGQIFLVEECLTGEEFSLFAICDGNNYKIISFAQDHKTVYNCDLGPNTGGMGCISPIKLITLSIQKTIEQKILKPFMQGMQKEERPYKGILYLGGIINNLPDGGVLKIIEFNARWGDPEAQVILPGIKNDYLNVVLSTMKQYSNETIILDQKVRVSIAGCSRGYPVDYSMVKGKEIFGLEKAMELPGITIYGAGIVRKDYRFFANGGRVFHLVAEGKDIIDARKKAYQAMSAIFIEGNNLHYRTDVGWRDVERKFS